MSSSNVEDNLKWCVSCNRRKGVGYRCRVYKERVHEVEKEDHFVFCCNCVDEWQDYWQGYYGLNFYTVVSHWAFNPSLSYFS